MKFTIKTIGCKVNTYESNKIKSELINLGFDYLDVKDKDGYKDLDFYIVNTCSVTSIADKKSRQMLHLAKKYNKNVKVIAIGCLVNSLNVWADDIRPIYYAEKDNNNEVCTENFVKKNILDGVDYLIPNDEKDKLPELILTLSKTVAASSKTVGATHYEPSPAGTSPSRIRAFIKIQDGCDEYCSYCLIPYLRGHIRSRDEEEILSEIRECIKNGVKEIVLTGIHLSSYGLDKEKISYEKEGAIGIARSKLLSLIHRITELKLSVNGEERELERLRLGSLEPRIIDEIFLSAIAPSSKFCANFCLSLQSGCDKTLKRMNRHYTTGDFEKACTLIRKYIPYATITTDVIVGFPGETDEDYEESLNFVKKMRFYNPNIFPYSIRKGTKAAEFTGQLSNGIKHERTLRMIKECELISYEVEKEILSMKEKLFGKDANEILVEEIIEKDGAKYKVGYTKEYIRKVLFVDK